MISVPLFRSSSFVGAVNRYGISVAATALQKLNIFLLHRVCCPQNRLEIQAAGLLRGSLRFSAGLQQQTVGFASSSLII